MIILSFVGDSCRVHLSHGKELENKPFTETKARKCLLLMRTSKHSTSYHLGWGAVAENPNYPRPKGLGETFHGGEEGHLFNVRTAMIPFLLTLGLAQGLLCTALPLQPLRFNDDGAFKIALFTDLHYGESSELDLKSDEVLYAS